MASSWFYYKEICYDARSRERKILFELQTYESWLLNYIHTFLKYCVLQGSKYTTLQNHHSFLRLVK
jgi:hypothetical protein